MGLDQYLYASKNVGNAEWRGDEENKQFSEIINAMNAHDMIDGEEIPNATVMLRVGYWRKANQVHGWFVKHVQFGNDDCREYDVSRAELQGLLTACQNVKQNPSMAEEVLPPSEGFFFGSDEIDEWYWHDIDYTIELVSRVLRTVSEDWSLTYRASW
jgi:hypothetical protein